MTTLERRQYVRHRTSGDLGFVIVEGGEQRVQLDRPDQRIVKKLTAEWKPETLDRKFTKAQVAKVAFEADVAVCALLQLHELSRRSWIGIRDSERVKFIEKGPGGPELRQKIWQLLMGELGKLAR